MGEIGENQMNPKEEILIKIWNNWFKMFGYEKDMKERINYELEKINSELRIGMRKLNTDSMSDYLKKIEDKVQRGLSVSPKELNDLWDYYHVISSR